MKPYYLKRTVALGRQEWSSRLASRYSPVPNGSGWLNLSMFIRRTGNKHMLNNIRHVGKLVELLPSSVSGTAAIRC